VVAKPVVSIAYAVRAVLAVEAVVFGSTTLTLAESDIEPLPDTAVTSVSEEEEEEEEEELSDFAQPMITKLMIPRKISKLVKFFINFSIKC
jgi:hypothetical protein